MVRIALVGCGAIAERFYLPALSDMSYLFDEVYLVDTNLSRAQELSANFGIGKCLTDYHALLDRLDGAIIAVPPEYHHPISMEFIERGIHVLCEKPLADSPQQVEEMVSKSDETGAGIAVNNTRRLFPSFLGVKRLISEGMIGKLLTIEHSEGGEFNWPTVSGFYFRVNRSPRGVIQDRGAHVFDLISWWLGGKPRLVHVYHDSFGGCEAYARVKLIFHDCSINVRLSWLFRQKNRYLIKGESGSIEGDISDWRSFELRTKSRKRKISVKTPENSFYDFSRKLIHNFVDVITGKNPPLIPAREVLHSIQLIEECYRSANRFNMPWYEVQ